MEPKQLEEPLYFLNVKTGDTFITWFKENIIHEENWVEISKVVYYKFIYGTEGE